MRRPLRHLAVSLLLLAATVATAAPAQAAQVTASRSGATMIVTSGGESWVSISLGTGEDGPTAVLTASDPATTVAAGSGCSREPDANYVTCEGASTFAYTGSAERDRVNVPAAASGTVSLGEGFDDAIIESGTGTVSVDGGGGTTDSLVVSGRANVNFANGTAQLNGNQFGAMTGSVDFTGIETFHGHQGSNVVGSTGDERASFQSTTETGLTTTADMGPGDDSVIMDLRESHVMNVQASLGIGADLLLIAHSAFGVPVGSFTLDTALDRLVKHGTPDQVVAGVTGLERFVGNSIPGTTQSERVVDPGGELTEVYLGGGVDRVAMENDVAQKIDCGAGEDVVESADEDDELVACEGGPIAIIVNDAGDAADHDTTDSQCDADDAEAGLQCTLRAALEEATAQGAAQQIDFEIGGSGTPTIAAASPLPPVPAGVTVDATTQPGDATAANGLAEVILNGDGAGDDAIGIELKGAAAKVRGLKVMGFDGPAVKATGTNASVAANALTENGTGVEIAGTGVKVGGAGAADRNFIWKNGKTDEEAEAASSELPANASDAQIRSKFAELGAGVLMTSSAAVNAVIEGNALGFGPTGSVDLQSPVGVLVAPVDGDPSGAEVRNNDITGNAFGVVALPVSGAFGDPAPLRLVGNRVGTAPQGRSLEALGALFGVLAIRSPGVVVGTADAGNAIQNTIGAVLAIGEGNLEVKGNEIGKGGSFGDVIEELQSSSSARPGLAGLNLFGVTLVESTGARVGGAGEAGNKIGPCLTCVQVGGLTSSANDISGNTIGLPTSGGDAYPTSLKALGAITGIVVSGGLDNTLGLEAPNTVRGSALGAILQATNGLGVYDTVIDETLIGAVVANADGLEFGQAGKGNEVTDSFMGLLVTGWEPTEKELNAAGISKAQWDAFDRKLAYTLPASQPLLNVINAVEPEAEVAQAVALSPAPSSAARRAAAGRRDGVFGTDDLSLTANRFGRTAAGAEHENVVNAWIRGDVRDVDVSDNTIVHARAGGIWLGPNVQGHNVERVRLSDNRILDNYSVGSPVLLGVKGLGFDHLEPAAREVYENAFGPTLPDPGDADSGPNGFQNQPVLNSVERTAEGLHVRGVASGKPNTPLSVEFFANEFCNPFGFGEGERPIAQKLAVTTGADGTISIDVTVPAPAGFNNRLTAMATGPEGTSEFSACATVTDPATPDPDPGPAPPGDSPPPGPPGPPGPGPGPGPTPPLDGPTAQQQADDIAGDAKTTNTGNVTLTGTTTGGDATFTATTGTAGSRAVAAATLRVFRVKRKLAPGFFRVTLKPTAKAKRILRRKKRLRIRLTVAFKPTGSSTTAIARRTLTLRVRKAPR